MVPFSIPKNQFLSADGYHFANLSASQYYINPAFDAQYLFFQMKQQLNAQSGFIYLPFLYWDPQSIEDWFQVLKEQSFLSTMGELPIPWIVDEILIHLQESKVKPEKISFIALSPRESDNEIKIAGRLQSKQTLPIDYHLIDSSPLFLRIAYQRLLSQVRFSDKFSIFPIEGDITAFSEIPFFTKEVLAKKTRELRIGSMLGYTFVNLPNEAAFIQQSLDSFQQGDLFLLDVCLNYAPANEPEKIIKNDPRFNDYPWKESWEKWIRGPLERYRPGVKNIEIQTVLDNRTCAIPDSYAAVIKANIDKKTQLTLIKIKRYQQESLIHTFANLGWKPLSGKLFGEDNLRLVYLFEKQ